jgi:hydrogenase maturation factor
MMEHCDDVCITCGDVAVALTVVALEPDAARCIDDEGRLEMVAIDLVAPVRPGDRVLAHAGVALVRLDDAPPPRAVEDAR